MFRTICGYILTTIGFALLGIAGLGAMLACLACIAGMSGADVWECLTVFLVGLGVAGLMTMLGTTLVDVGDDLRAPRIKLDF